jgi:hypothetical protein
MAGAILGAAAFLVRPILDMEKLAAIEQAQR